MKRAAFALVTIALCSATDAWALCPNCLAQAQSLTPKLRLLGAFLLLPFLVALIALRKIRRLQRQSEHSERV